tara:strand:+ start:503 stop:1216 length:714 start_codon:yes stop_codon:yes gene_type:complete
MKFIKIYGIQRTGTNYTEWLCKNNFKDVNVLRDGNILGWKHGKPIDFESVDWSGSNWDDPKHINDDDVQKQVKGYLIEVTKIRKDLEDANNQKDLKYVLCFRNPYSWILSKGPRWVGYDRDLLGAIQYWSRKAKEYCEFYDQNKDISIMFTHWDLISDPSYQMKRIQDKFGLVPMKDEFVSQELEIGPRLDIDGTRFNSAKYHRKNSFLDRLHPGALKIISAAVDKEVMNKLGFEVL